MPLLHRQQRRNNTPGIIPVQPVTDRIMVPPVTPVVIPTLRTGTQTPPWVTQCLVTQHALNALITLENMALNTVFTMVTLT
jgi:hypothetical protein